MVALPLAAGPPLTGQQDMPSLWRKVGSRARPRQTGRRYLPELEEVKGILMGVNEFQPVSPSRARVRLVASDNGPFRLRPRLPSAGIQTDQKTLAYCRVGGCLVQVNVGAGSLRSDGPQVLVPVVDIDVDLSFELSPVRAEALNRTLIMYRHGFLGQPGESNHAAGVSANSRRTTAGARKPRRSISHCWL